MWHCDGTAKEKQVLEASSSLLRAWRIEFETPIYALTELVRVCICFISLNQRALEEGKLYPLHLSLILVVAIKISTHWPNPVSPLLSTRFIIVCLLVLIHDYNRHTAHLKIKNEKQ